MDELAAALRDYVSFLAAKELLAYERSIDPTKVKEILETLKRLTKEKK